MNTLSRSSRALPLILAASKAQSWVDVLRVYESCCNSMRGIYDPSVLELKKGMHSMISPWSLNLFYHGILKANQSNQPPHDELVLAALKQFKTYRVTIEMEKIMNEDVNENSVEGVQSNFLMAVTVGMWEKALKIWSENKVVQTSIASRRHLINALASAGKLELAVPLLYSIEGVNLSPYLTRPIVKELIMRHEYENALRIVSCVLAEGYGLEVSLFSAILPIFLYYHMSELALERAVEFNIYAVTRAEVQRFTGLFGYLLQCLYDVNLYPHFNQEQIVEDVMSRMTPSSSGVKRHSKNAHFRLLTEREVLERVKSHIHLLHMIYARLIPLPRWFNRSVSYIVQQALATHSLMVVMDTNILIQCSSKNYGLDHFYSAMMNQHPEMKEYKFATIVVPFTVVQEVHKLIWNANNRIRHALRVLIWSRVLNFLRQPNVFTLSLLADCGNSGFSVIGQMAYSKLPAALAISTSGDPDLRILNVCVGIQHAIRAKTVTTRHGCNYAEGAHLFALLKYHVRRFRNEVKGNATSQLLLCTLDKKLSRAAELLGIASFPAPHKTVTTDNHQITENDNVEYHNNSKNNINGNDDKDNNHVCDEHVDTSTTTIDSAPLTTNITNIANDFDNNDANVCICSDDDDDVSSNVSNIRESELTGISGDFELSSTSSGCSEDYHKN